VRRHAWAPWRDSGWAGLCVDALAQLVLTNSLVTMFFPVAAIEHEEVACGSLAHQLRGWR